MALKFDASRPVAVEDALAGCAASYGDAADVVVGSTCLAGAERENFPKVPISLKNLSL